MATTTIPVPTKALPAPRRFTVAEYHRVVEAGILHEDERLELIDGVIVHKMPTNLPHRGTVIRLIRVFIVALHDRALVQSQGSTGLDNYWEPEPDISVLRMRDDEYTREPVRPEEVLLVMEVADTSLAYDRDVKGKRYSEAQIPEFWLWDINGGALLIHRDPHPDGYHQIITIRGDQPASPLAFPDLVVTPDGILPPPPAPSTSA